jgi:hypothetical protein
MPELILAAGVVLLLAMYLGGHPAVFVVLWLLGVCFVPWWVGTKVQSFLPLAAILSLLGLLCLAPQVPRRITLPDIGILTFFVACLLPAAIGGSIKSGTFGAAVIWFPAYLVGRRLPARIDLRRIYGYVALFFTVVSVLAIVEFLFSWNPFIDVHFGSASSYATWGTLQTRGGVLRAEGAFGHSIALGASLAVAIPLTLASRLRLSVRVVAVALMLAASVVTFSRTGMLCAVLGILGSIAFLTTEITRRLRVALGSVVCVMSLFLVPLINSTFSAAGSEATRSASYRDQLTSVLSHLNVVGLSDEARRLPDGTLYFGSFRSIDSQLVLTGLTYGAFALTVACVALLAGCLTVLRRRAAAPTIAVVCQIPALATVALITQYAVFFWFAVGLAVAAQSARTEAMQGAHFRASGEVPTPHRDDDRYRGRELTTHANASAAYV